MPESFSLSQKPFRLCPQIVRISTCLSCFLWTEPVILSVHTSVLSANRRKHVCRNLYRAFYFLCKRDHLFQILYILRRHAAIEFNRHAGFFQILNRIADLFKCRSISAQLLIGVFTAAIQSQIDAHRRLFCKPLRPIAVNERAIAVHADLHAHID